MKENKETKIVDKAKNQIGALKLIEIEIGKCYIY